MDFHPVTRVLYALCERDDEEDDFSVLITIDTTTGVGTEIGRTFAEDIGDFSFGAFTDMSFRNSDNVLYAHAESDEEIMTIDVTTGLATDLDAGSVGCAGNGLAFSPDDTLYLASCEELITIDQSDGDFIDSVEGDLFINGMDYDPVSGVLYGICKDCPSSDRSLVTIDVDEFTSITFIPTEDGMDAIAVCDGSCGNGKKDGDDDNWRTKPTFGISPTTHNLVIKCGFGMGQSCFDMTDEWHTPFDKIVINTGETHDFQLNVLAQMRLKNAGFCLVPQVGSMEGELCIGVSLDGNGNIIGSTINQKEGLVDESIITFTSTRDGAYNNIRINDVKFLDQPFYEVIGLYATDYQPRVVNTFLNEGIDVIGKSFLEQPVIQIASNTKAKSGNSGMITLTRLDKFENVWGTESGILYTFNESRSPIKLTPDVVTRITDETQMVMTRTNSNFQLIVDWTTDQAEQKMREMYPSLFKEVAYAELDNIKTSKEPYINHKQILAEKLFN